MKKILLSSIVIAALTGCQTAPQAVKTMTDTSAMNAKTVATTTRAMPFLGTVKAAGAAFGMLGALAVKDDAKNMAAGVNAPDPAVEISRQLLEILHANRGTQPAAGSVRVEPDATPEHVAAAANGNAQYVLDVETRAWMISYFPTDWTHYRLNYWANARLIDTATKTVVASGKCERIPATNAGAPTWDQWSQNDGAILKREITASVEACVATLKKDMLAL